MDYYTQKQIKIDIYWFNFKIKPVYIRNNPNTNEIILFKGIFSIYYKWN